MQPSNSTVYFAAYGSLIQQECGAIHGTPLPVKKAGGSYSSAWRATDLKIPADFLRASSIAAKTAAEGQTLRSTKSRVTLVPVNEGGQATPLFVAASRAHKVAGFGDTALVAACNAMKCREDLVAKRDARTANGDKSIAYVVQRELGSPSCPAGNTIARFTVNDKPFTARFNPQCFSLDTIKKMASWLLENQGKGLVIAQLPKNISSAAERERILQTETVPVGSTWKPAPGIKQRSAAYVQNLPESTREAQAQYCARFQSNN